MEIIWKIIYSLIGLNTIQICSGLPINILSSTEGWNSYIILIVTIALSASIITIVIGCVCCQRKQGFKEFRDSPVSASVISEQIEEDPGHVNPITTSEFTIFTPLSPPHHNNNVFRQIEATNSTERIQESCRKNNILTPEIRSWFGDSKINFSRHKLKYIRELGSGWFGRVVEGEALGITEEQVWTRVAVRILESCASTQEQALFLHEAAMYRLEQQHPNVLKLLGYSLEATPILLIQEYCSRGDLKKFLLENNSNCNSPIMVNLPLRFSCQITSAVQYLHENKLLHPDLAARNCQLTNDLNPKLGDYGSAVSHYPNDYYQGVPAIPVRWCAPETLNFTHTTLQPKQMTMEGNVWSLGITMWEICEWGSQPYETLTDDDVISQVLSSPHIRLSKPSKCKSFYTEHLYRLMQLCWMPEDERPTAGHIYDMLIHLLQLCNNGSPSKISDFSTEDFDSRWDNFKPNTIVKTDNHILLDNLAIPMGKITDINSMSSTGESNYPDVKKSASLTNLHGSFDNLVICEKNVNANTEFDSWLQNVVTDTGDMQYVRGLSEAINELDSALASEPTSSSSCSHEPSPSGDDWDITLPKQHDSVKVEFKLGEHANNNGTFSVESNDPSSLLDSILYARNESGSETEDETWKKRIERGAYSEKVRQKSKSVADLMILTHIDCSDTDSETPLQSLEWKHGGSAYKNVRCASKGALDTSMIFGSEGNLLQVQETFQEELRKLQEERRDSLLFVPSRCQTLEEQNKKKQCILPEKEIDNDLLFQTEFQTNDNLPQTSESHVQKTDDKIKNIEQPILNHTVEEMLQQSDCKDVIVMEKERESDISIEAKKPLKENCLNSCEKIMVENVELHVQNQYVHVDQINIKDAKTNNDSSLMSNYAKESSVQDKNLTKQVIPDSSVEENLTNNILCDKSTFMDDFNTSPENPIVPVPLLLDDAFHIYNFDKNIANSIAEFLDNERKFSQDDKPLKFVTSNEISDSTQVINTQNLMNFDSFSSPTSVKPQVFNVFSVTVDHKTPDFLNMSYTDSMEQNILKTLYNDPCESFNFTNDVSEKDLKSNLYTSTPLVNKSKYNTERSYVSENDETNRPTVILGPCEDYTLELYSGLKTTLDSYYDINDIRPEEEILQFSSNFMPFNSEFIKSYSANDVDAQSTICIETWDKFLDKSLRNNEKSPNNLTIDKLMNSETLLVHENEDAIDTQNELKEDDIKVNKTFDFDTDVDNKNSERKDKFDNCLNKTYDVISTMNNDTIKNSSDVSDATFTIKTNNLSITDTVTNSWEPGVGWFLHPQSQSEDLTGQIDVNTSEIDNSYVGFTLDEESVNALRNELAAKLPHAQGLTSEEQEMEEWDSEERDEMIVKYNVYATPLSPIPEESCCEDMFCDQTKHRDGSDSGSDWSEPGRISQSEDILIVDTETHTALILESPSPKGPLNRHTLSQDSCCSNDTLFNLEDLNFGTIDVESPCHDINLEESTELISMKNCLNEVSDCKQMQTSYVPDYVDDDKFNTNQYIENSFRNKNLTCTSEECSIDKSKLILTIEPGNLNTAPLPSPEDIPWRQLPASMLTYNQVAHGEKFDIKQTEQISADAETISEPNCNIEQQDVVSEDETELFNNLTDIRFVGPCDGQLMSTSFSESVENDRDWDSGSDTRSSSSGEFIWKEGEHEESLRALHHNEGIPNSVSPMDAISEEKSDASDNHDVDEDDNDDDDDDDDDDDEDELEETEFVPSAWDSQATPTKSALRSPEKKSKNQKGVWFKKEKYHCVYEYPREPDSPITQNTDLWRPLSDFSAYTDLWELDPDSCVAPIDDDIKENYDTCSNYTPRDYYQLASSSAHHRDLYQMNSYPDFTSGSAAPDEDFFISSTTKPFQSLNQGSQFFPGLNNKSSQWQTYQQSSLQSTRDLSENITPDSGIDDVTPASISDPQLNYLNFKDGLQLNSSGVSSLKLLAAAAVKKAGSNEINTDTVTNGSNQTITFESLGGLRHTRNKLKLDLPPSPSSFTSNRSFNIEFDADPIVHRDVPTFTTFGKSRFSVQHVDTPVEDEPNGTNKSKNVSFEALPHKPQKHEDQVKPEYVCNSVVVDVENKPKQVEVVRGEASLLDSADEDSGIESSANATLERQQVLNQE